MSELKLSGQQSYSCDSSYDNIGEWIRDELEEWLFSHDDLTFELKFKVIFPRLNLEKESTINIPPQTSYDYIGETMRCTIEGDWLKNHPDDDYNFTWSVELIKFPKPNLSI